MDWSRVGLGIGRDGEGECDGACICTRRARCPEGRATHALPVPRPRTPLAEAPPGWLTQAPIFPLFNAAQFQVIDVIISLFEGCTPL